MPQTEDRVAELSYIWHYVSNLAIFWLSSVIFIALASLALIGGSFCYDVLSSLWQTAAITAEARLGLKLTPSNVESAESAESAECAESGESADGADSGGSEGSDASDSGAASSANKGAKWKKSSQRAAERRQREAESGRNPLSYPTIVIRSKNDPQLSEDITLPNLKDLSTTNVPTAADPEAIKQLASILSAFYHSNKIVSTAEINNAPSEITVNDDKPISGQDGDQKSQDEPHPKGRGCCCGPLKPKSEGPTPPSMKDAEATTSQTTVASVPVAIGDAGTTILIPKNGAVVVVYASATSDKSSASEQLDNSKKPESPGDESSAKANESSTSPASNATLTNMKIYYIPDGNIQKFITGKDIEVKKSKESMTKNKMNVDEPTNRSLNLQQLLSSWNPSAVVQIPNQQFVMTSLLPQIQLLQSSQNNDASNIIPSLIPKKSLTQLNASTPQLDANTNNPQVLLSVAPEQVGHGDISVSAPVTSPVVEEKNPNTTVEPDDQEDKNQRQPKLGGACCGRNNKSPKGGRRCQCAELLSTKKQDFSSHSTLIKVTDIMAAESEHTEINQKPLRGVATCLLSEPSRPPLKQIDPELITVQEEAKFSDGAVTDTKPSSHSASPQTLDTDNSSAKTKENSSSRPSTPNEATSRIPILSIFKPFMPV